MKTSFEEIVSVEHIGKDENPFSLGSLIEKGCAENLPQAADDKTKTLLLCVDMQRDFMEGGPLGVSGSLCDARRLSQFIYKNITKITTIAASLDTHAPRQIFHPCWWRGADGGSPVPYTVITADDVKRGKWRPLYEEQESVEYLEHLAAGDKKQLIIWPYHCIAGTVGATLENQLSNMIHFFSAARGSDVKKIFKGSLPATEFYGILAPEYDPCGRSANRELTDELRLCDRIIVAGEARDFCVAESILQICEALQNEKQPPEIYALEDCMSCVAFPEAADAQYREFAQKYGVRLVRSTEDFL